MARVAPRAREGARHAIDASAIEDAFGIVRGMLGRPDLAASLETAFGADATPDAFANIVSDFDRNGWPAFVVTSVNVLQGARGAYAAATDTILPLAPIFARQRGRRQRHHGAAA